LIGCIASKSIVFELLLIGITPGVILPKIWHHPEGDFKILFGRIYHICYNLYGCYNGIPLLIGDFVDNLRNRENSPAKNVQAQSLVYEAYEE
jgi:hypothetical protein